MTGTHGKDDYVRLARHPRRPHTIDYVQTLLDDFCELRGDRCSGDDPAILAGCGRLAGRTIALLGHQKGRSSGENMRLNFGSARPEGHHKALRIMRHAEKFGFPLLCLIDTPGASPGRHAEERGQASAIAENLRTMVALSVPILAVIIGEGGSSGALALCMADRLVMLENAVYSVAVVAEPPAATGHSSATGGADVMHSTAAELMAAGIVDDVICEPPGGAHVDPKQTIRNVGQRIARVMDELVALPVCELLRRRHQKYRAIDAGTLLRVADQPGELWLPHAASFVLPG